MYLSKQKHIYDKYLIKAKNIKELILLKNYSK